MSGTTSQMTDVSPGTYFVHLFDVKAEQFRLLDRHAGSLDRPQLLANPLATVENICNKFKLVLNQRKIVCALERASRQQTRKNVAAPLRPGTKRRLESLPLITRHETFRLLDYNSILIFECLSVSFLQAGAEFGRWSELHLFEGNMGIVAASSLRYPIFAAGLGALGWPA